MKKAGLLLILFSIGSMLHFGLIDVHLYQDELIQKKIDFVIANNCLFRCGILIDILLFITILSIGIVFYNQVKNHNSFLSKLAISLILIQTSLSFVLEFVNIYLIILVQNLTSNVTESENVTSALNLILASKHLANTVVILLFGIAMSLFLYLFQRYNILSQKISLLGILIFSLLVFSILIKFTFPNFTVYFGLTTSVLLLLYQFILGFYLWLKKDNKEISF